MPRRHAALTAAATVLPLKRPVDARKALGKRQEWQDDGWAYFDEVPEFKQAVWFSGNQMAKLRLFIAEVPRGDEDPVRADSESSTLDPGVAAQAQVELDRLRAGLAGMGDLLRDANMNLEVAAECFLVGMAAREEILDPITREVTREATDEAWSIRSISEVEMKGSGKSARYLIKDDEGDKGTELNPDTDTVIRLYQKHPRWTARADCATRGVMGELEALVTLHRQVVAEANSKASAGFFTLPNELGLGKVDSEGSEDGQDAAEDPFMADMATALVDPISDPSHPSATTPMLLRGPAEFLKPDVLRHISLAREASKTLDDRIEARVKRLARGLNLPFEAVMGHQATTFANAEQVDQDQFDDHLHPRCVLLVNALTIGFLRSQLRADDSPVKASPDVNRVMVWFDPIDLIAQPDKSANAPEDLKVGAISWLAYRAARGWSEDDAPTEDELLQRAGLLSGTFGDDLTLALLRLLGQAGMNLEVVPTGPDALPADTAPAAEGEATVASAISAAIARGDTVEAQALILSELARRDPAAWTPLALSGGAPITAAGKVTPVRSTLGRDLLEVDRDLRTRLLVAADSSLGRALERAGARLRSKLPRSTKGLMATVPTAQLAARMGRDAVAELSVTPSDLLEGSFDGLREQFMAWGAGSQAEAMELATRVVSGFSLSERTALQLRQAENLEEAWGWLEQHLRGFAQEQLFDSSAAAVAGEVLDGLAVPAGMLRQAIAIAGGATIETTGIGGDAWTAITADGHALGGIGTGDLLMGALADHGAGVDGYRWVYGAAVRKTPFEPHRELDGVEFVNFDDDVLANTSGFPDLPYYMPGDHGGCICDFEPTIILPEEG